MPKLLYFKNLNWLKCYEIKKKCSTVNTITNNKHNSTSINDTLLKIYMQVDSDPPSNFTYASRGGFLWPKCLNYALTEKENSWVSTVTKNTQNLC